MKLLLVDDNIWIREIIKSICSENFDEIIECDDGDEAVSKYNLTLPDLVIMDIKMKRMDGIQATTKIISNYPEAKIIIISQYDDEEIIKIVKSIGAKNFVSKSNLIQLITIIKEITQ